MLDRSKPDLAQQKGESGSDLSPHPLFDPHWYAQQNPELPPERATFGHYLTEGWRNMKSPHPLFSVEYYFEQRPDVKAAGLEPLTHFITRGWKEGVKPHPEFNTRCYLEGNLNIALIDDDPLISDIAQERAGRRFSLPSNDAVRQISATADGPPLHLEEKDERESFGATTSFGNNNSRRHFKLATVADSAASDLGEKLLRSGLFDRDWYLQKYKDVARAGADPLGHFVGHGSAEMRNPGPQFDSSWYVEQYPEVLEGSLSPIEHYLNIGAQRQYKTSGSYYPIWRKRFDTLDDEDRRLIAEDIAARDLPYLRVKICVNRSTECFLDQTLKHVRRQLFRRVYVDIALSFDCSPESHEIAERFKYDNELFIEPDNHDKNTNSALYLVLPAGVLPREHAFYMFARHAFFDEEAELIYCDEDRIDHEGNPANPVFKPQYSPTLAAHTNYIGRCFLFRVKNPGTPGSAEIFSGAGPCVTDYLNKLLERRMPPVSSISCVLYHDCAPLERVAAADELQFDDGPRPSFTIIIPTRDRLELLGPCIKSIEALSDYPINKIELIIVDNGSVNADTLAFLNTLAAEKRAKIVRDDGNFNFARLNNVAAKYASNDVLLFVNNDTVVDDPAWLKRIATYVMERDVGAVGGKLLYPDRTIQHGGVILGIQGVAAHDSVGYDARDPRARLDETREMAAVTGACLAMRKCVFEEIGGFDEVAAVAFNDTLLCLDALKAGYRNIYISHPLLIHFESKSRGYDDAPERIALFRREARYARSRHNTYFMNDPYYSPNLSLQVPNELAFPPRELKPWRRDRKPGDPLKILFLSVTHEFGSGVAVVMSLQARYFANAGHAVYVAGPKAAREVPYIGCHRVYLDDPAKAAQFAVENGIDCVIAETPPFFSVARFLGDWPKTLFLDHGEPPPEFFPDKEGRESVLAEKQLCFSMASRIAAISRAVRDGGAFEDVSIIPNGNSHLLVWNENLAEQRHALRRRYGWEKKAVILNVCRFRAAERHYKGLDKAAEVLREYRFLRPKLTADTAFVLCGAATADDVEEMKKAGFAVFANITDTEMREFYLMADIYLNLSRWEGYNLGIGQALALGLPVIASDIPAHRAFPIFTSNDTLPLVEKLSAVVESVISSDFTQRDEPVIQAWDPSLQLLERDVLDLCCSPSRDHE